MGAREGRGLALKTNNSEWDPKHQPRQKHYFILAITYTITYMNWETLICLGDSITIGARSYLSYPDYCGSKLKEATSKYWNVVNHAKSGMTTIELVRSITDNFNNLISHQPNVITILIGTNDLKSDTPSSDFEIAYTQVIVKAKLILRTQNIILFEIPELQKGIMLPYNISMNQKVLEFNKIIQQLGKEHKLMVKKFAADQTDFYDGVHLNETGSKNWGTQLADIILQLRNG